MPEVCPRPGVHESSGLRPAVCPHAAVAEVTFGDETVSGEGRFFRGRSVEAAAPKYSEGY